MSDESEQGGTPKPDACPNPECGWYRPDCARDDYLLTAQVVCTACGTSGATVSAEDDDDLDRAEREAVRLWNRLPRAAGRGDLM